MLGVGHDEVSALTELPVHSRVETDVQQELCEHVLSGGAVSSGDKG